MVDAKTGQGFKTDIFNGQYDAELEQIPVYMRERVAFLIEQKVEKRVQEHMAVFREEVARELEDQRQQNEQHIAYYMDPNVRVISPLNKYRAPVNYPYQYQGYAPGYYTANQSRMYKMNQSISPVRLKNDFGLDNSRYQEQLELTDRKNSEMAKLDKKGYVTEASSAKPYKPFQAKKGQSKLPQDKWTGYTTTNYEEEKIKKDKLERRKQYDNTLKQRQT